jgi:guanylate kinase
VYAGQKSRKTIDLVLNTFIPEYEKLNLDYASRLDGENYIFKTEDEMINYFIENTGLCQTFYWNKYYDNPDKIMVGAIITADDKLIMSLTIDGTEETESKYFEKLKNLLNSDIGIISYIDPPDYDNGQDFITKYG